MEELIESLVKENEELSSKIDRLHDFIEDDDKFNQVSEMQRVLLINQYNLMTMYSYTLEERIYDLSR